MATAPRLNDPASVFLLDWAQTDTGRLALEIWIKPLNGAFRAAIDAAFTITLDANDAMLSSGAGAYVLPRGWTGLVGGTSKIIAVMFNSTESTSVPGQQVYVDPVVESSGAHSGMQKLVTLALDVKPLVAQVSPIQVNVEYFTDALNYSYKAGDPGFAGTLPEFSIAVPALAKVTGTDGADPALDASFAARALVVGLAGDDTAINLTAGDTFIGGPGFDTARLPNASSTYTAKLASSAMTGAIAQLAGADFQAGFPVFAIQSSGVSDPVFVQAEALQFGSSTTSVNPLRLLNTGTPIKLVSASDATAFKSVKLALAAASAGDTVIVSPNHQEPDSAPITVAVNDVRVLLINANAAPLVFRLAESAAVSRFTLLGDGLADVYGNSFPNIIIGNDASNLLDGGAGNDTVIGGGGDDMLSGGTGNDWLDGGAGADTASGGSGDDVLLASSDSASVPADQTGEDLLIGGSGADLLIAAASVQPLSVRMMGGSGTDVFRLVSLEGADGGAVALDALGVRMHIADLSASDGIDLSALLAANAGQAGYRSFTLANRVASERGDARISLSDAVIQGLQGPVQESGVRAAAPLTPVATSSLLSVSWWLTRRA